MVVHTSGTTGKPKRIELSRQAILNSAQLSVDYFKLKEQSKILLCLPLDKIGGIMLALRAFVANAEILPVDPKKNPFDGLEEHLSFDFASMVPNQLANCEGSWSKVKTILIGGGPLSAELQSKLTNASKDFAVYQSYASTETISHVALRSLHPNLDPFYHALTGVSFATNPEQCLIVNAPALNLKHLQTNDVVNLVDKTSFQWLGRKDNVVLSGGLKLYPEVLEGKLDLPFNFLLMGMEDPELGERLVLLMSKDNFSEHLPVSIREQLKGAERPKTIVLVPKLLFTETGKIKRSESWAQEKEIIPL